MSVAWHIAKKDVRRMALPVGAWIALMVLPTVGLRLFAPSVTGHASSSLDATATLVAMWSRLIGVVQAVMGYVLVAALVLEDPLVRTSAFWMTRPIARGQLLAAKLMAAALLFLVAPGIALAPVWLASGFGFGDVFSAWASSLKWQAPATLLALTFASIARSFAQVFLYTAGLVAAEFALLWLSAPFFSGVSVPVRWTRDFLGHAGLLPLFALVLVQQFHTRRLPRAWATLAAIFVVGLAIRAAWPWEAGSATWTRTDAPPRMELPADRAADITAEPTWTKFQANALPTLFVSAPWGRDGYYVPVLARLADGRIARGPGGAGQSQAGLRVLGFNQEQTPLRWQIMAPGTIESVGPGSLEVWAVRPHVLGEIPLQIGAKLATGAQRVRIIELVRKEGRLDEVFLEERDRHGELHGDRWQEMTRHIDQYFLVHRATGKARYTHVSDVGPPVAMNGLALRYRRLGVSGGDDWAGAVLVKLRLEGERRFERPLEAREVITESRSHPR